MDGLGYPGLWLVFTRSKSTEQRRVIANVYPPLRAPNSAALEVRIQRSFIISSQFQFLTRLMSVSFHNVPIQIVFPCEATFCAGDSIAAVKSSPSMLRLVPSKILV
jgi:hypothetical protein